MTMLAVIDKKSRIAKHGHGVNHCCLTTLKVHHNDPSLSGHYRGTYWRRLYVIRRRRCGTEVWETCWRPGRSALTSTLSSWWWCCRCGVVAHGTGVCCSYLMNWTSAVSTAFLLLLLQRVTTIFSASVLEPYLSEVQQSFRFVHKQFHCILHSVIIIYL